MTRLQTACYALIASALVLSGLLAIQLDGYTQKADAALVISGDAFTLLTAQTSNQEESLFVLNNLTGQLVVYRTALGGKAGTGVQPVAGQNLSQLFDGINQGGRPRR